MTRTTTNDDAAKTIRDPAARGTLSKILSRITTKTRWIISAAVGLITPVVLVAESAAEPLARAIACFGNGSLMALAASANAFTMIH